MQILIIFLVYDNDIIPPEVIALGNACGTFEFNQWKYYSDLDVDNATLDLQIDYCQEVARVNIYY